MAVQIISTGSYIPERVVTNEDLSEFLETSDEWINSRCGIETRHIATQDTTSSMGIHAARAALEKSGLSADDIQLVICTTVTPDTSVPMVAANIKKGLGIESAAAFDLNGNCTGFISALTVAESLMKTAGYQHALIVGSDTNSQMVDWTDRSTCVLFGDGAGAVILSSTDSRGIIASHLDCIIDSEEALLAENYMQKTPFDVEERPARSHLAMKGSKVMRFAVKTGVRTIKNILEKENIPLESIKYVVPHQANIRIIESISKGLKLDIDRFYINIQKYANTSSASIGVALDELISSGKVERGDLLLFVAFGGGLTSGVTLLEW